MLRNKEDRRLSRFSHWLHRTFDDWFFRYLLGPAQVDDARDGTDPAARERWKHDLENRKRYTQAQRTRSRLARAAKVETDHSARPSRRSGSR